MEFSKTVLRHVYIDVTVKDYMLDEVYLYQIDYKGDKSFRNEEIVFSQPLPYEGTDDEGNVITVPAEDVDLRGLFFDKIVEYRNSGVETRYFAINAKEVMLNLVDPLKKSNPKAKRMFNEMASECLPHEWMTDCLSMLRVIPMTDFDEIPEMGAGVRRKLKEKFHEVANEIKREKKMHIFTSYETPVTGPELIFCITDENMNIIEDVRLHGQINDDVVISKASNFVKKYPEADILINRTEARLYALFKRVETFTGEVSTGIIYSVESMLTALGKKNAETNFETYRDYIKNAEDLRFGRFDDNKIHSIHTFRLPLSYNSESAWEKNFSGNSMWKCDDDYGISYTLVGDNKEANEKKGSEKIANVEIFGKLSVEKDRERFVLRVSRVNIKRYVSGYAVLTVEAENHFYPGRKDKERISELCSSLWRSKLIGDSYPDILNIQMRCGDRIYSMEADQRAEGDTVPWVALLLDLGRKKKNTGAVKFTASTLSDKMFAMIDEGDVKRIENANDEIINKCLIKSEYLLQLEMYLAEVIAPKGNRGFGSLTKSQKKQVKQIANALAYMVGSYCYVEEQGEYAGAYKYVNKVRKIRETEDRLERKLDLLYE
ncbi:MAG: hypothetical protein IJS80_03385 [Lachnospiraceae bacterium]|nr:hypothetical protein [Lachnospiraceae bacterium]